MHLLENLSCPCNHELKFSQNTQDLMKWFENLNYIFAKINHFCWTGLKNCPCYYELKFLLKKQFWWCHLKFWTGAIIKNWNFAKIGSLDDVTQKFDLPLLSQAEIFHKIKPFWWFHLKVWPGLIIMRQPSPQNKAVLLMWFEILNYPYYYKVKFSIK